MTDVGSGERIQGEDYDSLHLTVALGATSTGTCSASC